MTNRVELETSLSHPHSEYAGVSYRVGVAVLLALAWVLAIGLLDRMSPSARDAEAPTFYGP